MSTQEMSVELSIPETKTGGNFPKLDFMEDEDLEVAVVLIG